MYYNTFPPPMSLLKCWECISKKNTDRHTNTNTSLTSIVKPPANISRRTR